VIPAVERRVEPIRTSRIAQCVLEVDDGIECAGGPDPRIDPAAPLAAGLSVDERSLDALAGQHRAAIDPDATSTGPCDEGLHAVNDLGGRDLIFIAGRVTNPDRLTSRKEIEVRSA
jgi:hypothetical protein